MSSVDDAGVRTWTPRFELEHVKLYAEYTPLEVKLVVVVLFSVLLVLIGPQTAAEAIDGTAKAAIAVMAAMSVVFLMVFIGYCSL